MALASTNTFGAGPDLDLRPEEMMRSTMHAWVQECPACGYVAKEVSDPSGVSREWLQSEKYRTCEGIAFQSGLAKRFYQYYLISAEDHKIEDAFGGMIRAAWSCDDVRDEENAVLCRKKAIQLLESFVQGDADRRNTLLLIKADLMRRADFLISCFRNMPMFILKKSS